MPNYPQSLLFTAGWPQAWLKEITGLEEQAVAGTRVTDAIALIDRLLVPGPGPAVSARQLTSADRDRLLASIYQHTYDDRIKGTLECNACAAPFDMDFSLSEFVGHTYTAEGDAVASPLPDGSYALADGLHMRLPTGEDELAVLGMDADRATQTLLQRCLVAGDLAAAVGLAQDAFEHIAPMLQTEMEAQCSECGHGMTVLFDVQTYLLQALLQDQERLSYEVHRLATAYGWSLKSILKLPRNTRRHYARLIEAELSSAY